MTHLEQWQASPGDQKEAEDFFTKGAGQRLLLAWREMSPVQASRLPGLDGVYEDSKNVQRRDGWDQCLNAVTGFYFSALQGGKTQTEGRRALEEDRQRKLNINRNAP